MDFDAVVLAGSGKDDWLAPEGVENKSLLAIDGRPMVEFVIRALKGSRYLKSLILVADFPLPPDLEALVDKMVPAGETIEENVARGVNVASSPLVAIVGSDLPFLSSRTMDELISMCQAHPASLYLPVVSREAIEKAFPGSQRTYARLKEGRVKAGNIFLFKRESWPTVEAFLSKVIAGRKQMWKLAAILGWKYILKFLLGRLSIPELEKVVAREASCPVKALSIDAPELGVDVDKLDDLILARAVLEK